MSKGKASTELRGAQTATCNECALRLDYYISIDSKIRCFRFTY